MKATYLSIAILLIVSAVNSAPLKRQQKTDPCANATTTVEMKECAWKEYQKVDSELNKVYRELMAKLDDEQHKAKLKAAEQSWLKYRDANCDFEDYFYHGGTVQSLVRTGCLTRMTQARVKELRETLKSELRK